MSLDIRYYKYPYCAPRSGAWTGADGLWVELSGKMNVLARLLSELRQKTDDRIVLVSNYTQVISCSLIVVNPLPQGAGAGGFLFALVLC